MCCAQQTGFGGKQPPKKVIAIAFLVYFIIAFLLSETFILTHADHEHDHNGTHGACTVCSQLQNAGTALKQLGMSVACSMPILAGLFAVGAIIKYIYSNIVILTPVVLKIRINS